MARPSVSAFTGKALTTWLKETLGERVAEVKASDRLVDSPALALNADKFMSPHMRRMMKAMNKDGADSPLRVIISDGTQQFWDSLFVDSGDVRRDLRLAYRHDFGSRLAIDIATTAGTATPRQFSHESQKVYMTGDLQTIFLCEFEGPRERKIYVTVI